MQVAQVLLPGLLVIASSQEYGPGVRRKALSIAHSLASSLSSKQSPTDRDTRHTLGTLLEAWLSPICTILREPISGQVRSIQPFRSSLHVYAPEIHWPHYNALSSQQSPSDTKRMQCPWQSPLDMAATVSFVLASPQAHELVNVMCLILRQLCVHDQNFSSCTGTQLLGTCLLSSPPHTKSDGCWLTKERLCKTMLVMRRMRGAGA